MLITVLIICVGVALTTSLCVSSWSAADLDGAIIIDSGIQNRIEYAANILAKLVRMAKPRQTKGAAIWNDILDASDHEDCGQP